MMQNRLYWTAIVLSSLAIALSSFSLIKTCHSNSHPENLLELLLERAKLCVSNNKDLNAKETILTLLRELENSGTIMERGSDELRIKYVHSQGAIEHVLSCSMVLGELKNLVGVIHTPQPATPLCTEVHHLDDQLLDSSIRWNLDKLLTVRSRAVVIRDYLDKGGRLYIAYPEGGLEKRTVAQQAIYRAELERYADNLFDCVLNCQIMDPDKVGATYFFKCSKGNIYAFSIKANQANDPKADSEWGLWIGLIDEPIITQRINEIMGYLDRNNGPTLKDMISI